MSRSPYTRAIKIRERKSSRKKRDIDEEMEEWRAYWREAGPVRFAEEVLFCWPEVSPHPTLGKVPTYNILSDEQRAFLTDLWKEGMVGFILAAGRGAGKTYTLAMYTCWRVTCFDNFSMTVMGGASEQSIKIKQYIDFWRRADELFYCLPKSVQSVKEAPHVLSRWNSKARFPACSEVGSRGPHVSQVLIDEVCIGESKGKDGAKAIRSAPFQLTSSPAALLGYTSTAQFITGTFVNIWKNFKKLNYKRYRWSIAKYYDEGAWYKKGTKEPNWDLIDTVLFKDRNPKHWLSNLWWIPDSTIQNLRRGTSTRQSLSDDEWLVEVLGGISRGTGLVFSRTDLEACICNGSKYTNDKNPCEECEPYTDKCPMMKKKELKLSMISNRKAGGDFGDPAPNALTIVGQRGKIIYILYSDERTGLRIDEVIDWFDKYCKKYKIFEIFADPSARGIIEGLENKEYSCPNIWRAGGGIKKNFYVVRYKRFIESHRFFIPIKFAFLIESLTGLSHDGKGGIQKHADHSFDSHLYSVVDYAPDEDTEAIWTEMKGKTISPW